MRNSLTSSRSLGASAPASPSSSSVTSSRPVTSDPFADILSEIEQYKSDPYIYSQLMNSYKKYISQKFSPTFFQSIGSWFGDNSAEQNFTNEQISGLRADMQRILEGKHKEDITDPVYQASQLASAGQNIDLNGGQGLSPQDPANIDQPDLDNPLQNSGYSSMQDIAQIGVSVASFALQAYQGFMNVKSLTLDNAMKEFSLSSEAKNLAWQTIGEGITEFIGANPKYTAEEILDPSFTPLRESIVQSFGSRINHLPLSRKQRRYMHNIIDELIYSTDSDGNKVPTAKYQTLIQNTLKDLSNSRADYTEAYGRVGADTDDLAVQRVLADDIFRPLNQMAYELQEDLNHVSKLQAQFDANYYSQANNLGLGQMSAKADFASKQLQHEINKTKNKVTAVFKAIDKKLESNKKIGPNWKMAFQTALALGESFTMNQLLNSASSFSFGFQHRNGVADTRRVDVYNR